MIELIRTQLEPRYPCDLVNALVDSYTELKNNFKLGRFKPSELEGGFFVECVRRIIEFELFGTATPIGKTLSSFNDNEMQRYERATGDESFRIHIPRVLKSIYNIRNRRGVGHLSKVSPNLIDSTYIVAACDWVMAELLRQVSNLEPEKCQSIVDSIVQRKLPMVFEDGDTQRILDLKMNAKDKVLVLLHHNSQQIEDEKLSNWIEYSNISLFRSRILKPLHHGRLIEYRKDGTCVLTPKGIEYVEEFIQQRS